MKKETTDFIMQLMNPLIALAMVVVTAFTVSNHNTQVKMDKNIETRKFCMEFQNWFRESNYASGHLGLELAFVHAWMGVPTCPDSIKTVWANLSIDERKVILSNSRAFSKLFNLFETAKQMHTSNPELLDVEHFINAFTSTFLDLENIDSPKADSIIQLIRKERGNDRIFDGYRYVTDNILFKRMCEKFPNFTEQKKERDRIEKSLEKKNKVNDKIKQDSLKHKKTNLHSL